jgi:hypothetical protein
MFGFFIVVQLLFAMSLFGGVKEEWVARYDSICSTDAAACLAVDGAGNLYVAGYGNRGVAGRDYLTIRYNPENGDTLWTSFYTGRNITNSNDWIIDMAVDGDGYIYVTGASIDSVHYNIVTVKIDSLDGDTLWTDRYKGPHRLGSTGHAIAVNDTGVYVTGYVDNTDANHLDCVTIRYDKENGDTIWTSTYNGPASHIDAGYDIVLDSAGYIYVTGTAKGIESYYDYLTIKYDPETGYSLWVAIYNGPGNGEDQARGIALDDSGYVYVTGYSLAEAGSFEIATIKYDPDTGDSLWVKRYDNHQILSEHGNPYITVDEPGNVYVAGPYWNGTNYDYVTIKYDAFGNECWDTTYSGPGNGDDWPRDIALDRCGYVYVTGKSEDDTTGLDYATVKYDPDTGDKLWVMRYNGTGNGIDYAEAITVDDDFNVYVTGVSTGDTTGYDWATIKYSQPGVFIRLTPSGPVDVPRGGNLEFDAFIRNCTDRDVRGEYWRTVLFPDSTEIFIPSGLLYYVNPLPGQVPRQGSQEIYDGLFIPMPADTGSYNLIGRIGVYPDRIIDADSLGFQVIE